MDNADLIAELQSARDEALAWHYVATKAQEQVARLQDEIEALKERLHGVQPLSTEGHAEEAK